MPLFLGPVVYMLRLGECEVRTRLYGESGQGQSDVSGRETEALGALWIAPDSD